MKTEGLGSRLRVTVRPLAEYTAAALTGDIDFTTSQRLEHQLASALADAKTALIIDLTRVGFCDSSGLSALAHIRRLSQARGRTVVLVGVSGRVANVFSLTSMDAVFYMQPDLDTAVRWLEGGAPTS
jgi:anti-anti-sigma factor